MSQQQRRRPSAQGNAPQKAAAPAARKPVFPSINFWSLFEPAPLSPHPDIDRYLPKVLIGSVVVVTGIMSCLELTQGWFGQAEEEEDVEQAGQPAPAQFSRKLVVHDKPIPVENWPRNVEGKLIFQPTYEWQDVPQDCVCPPGLEYQLDAQTGRRVARASRKTK